MSAARLNVWVTAVGDPCRIDNEHQWFVHVLHCEGDVLRWCGRAFTNIPTRCGHVEFDVPPGCYMVCATWSPGAPAAGRPTSLGNHISHLVTVRANCGDHVCVTLFPPTFHHCGIWWLVAARAAIERGELDRKAGGAAVEAVERLVATLEPDPFTEKMNEIQDSKEEWKPPDDQR
jgi:hypothetical protein